MNRPATLDRRASGPLFLNGVETERRNWLASRPMAFAACWAKSLMSHGLPVEFTKAHYERVWLASRRVSEKILMRKLVIIRARFGTSRKLRRLRKICAVVVSG